jgi:hypothetical protein
MSSEKQLKALQEYGFKIGSVNITTELKKNGDLRKVPSYPNGSWKENEPIITDKCNSYYIRTGTYNNLIVLDLDDMENDKCIEMFELAKKCKLQIKTRKGYHFYFKYDVDFPNSIRGSSGLGIPFDLQSNDAMVFCPPGTYKSVKDDKVYKYTIHKNEGFGKMPSELKEYINNLLKGKDVINPKPKTIKPKTIKPNNPDEPKHDISNKDIIIRLINGLKPERSTYAPNWKAGAFCMKSEDYDVSYFHYFSKLHYKNYDEQECEKLYTKLKAKTKEEKRMTMSTMWFWLKEDDKELFDKLTEEEFNEKLEIDLSKYTEFDSQIFVDLYFLDIKELKNKYEVIFNKTRSFKYFDKFHYHDITQGCIYELSEDEIIAYPKDPFPNLNTRNINFIYMYQHEPTIRLVRKIVFNPSSKYNGKINEINLFTGFKFPQLPITSDIDPFINHIKSLLNDKPIEYDYVLNWISHIFQYPNIKTKAALVFYSDTEGTGKNIIFDTLEKILGKYYFHMEQMIDFTKRFNSQFQNKLLIVGDEINARMKEASSELKNVITKQTINIEHKNHDPVKLADYANYVFTTNNENVFKISVTDRRMAIFHCKEEKIKKTIVRNIIDIQEDDTKLSQLMTYFLTRDISQFDPEVFPITEHKRDLIKMDLPAYIRMFITDLDLFVDEELTSERIYKMSIDYAKLNNLVRTYTSRKCSLDIKKLFNKFYVRKLDKRFYFFEKSDSLKKYIHDIIEEYIKKITTR